MLEGILRNDNPDFVSLVLRGIGEMLGVKDNGSPDTAISWIDLSPETDEFGFRRAYVHLKTTPPDDELWGEMDEAMYRIAEVLGAGATEFWVDGGWSGPGTSLASSSRRAVSAMRSARLTMNAARCGWANPHLTHPRTVRADSAT